MSPLLRRVGPALRLLRHHRGLRQVELAERAGVTRAKLSAYERRRRLPLLRTLATLLDALDARLLDLGVAVERTQQQMRAPLVRASAIIVPGHLEERRMSTLDMHPREDVRRQLAKVVEGANVSDEQLDDLVDTYAGLVERREDDLREHRRREKRLLAVVIGWLVLVVLLWWTIGRSPVVRLEEDSADAVLKVPKALGWERRTIRYWEPPPANWDYPGWYYRTASDTWAPLIASDSADPGPMEIR